MAEQRLIDANALIAQLEDIVSDYTSNGMFPNGYDINAAIDSLEDAPTIDPETIPVVRQLREELARVTAERDAAVKDLETAMRIDSEADDMGLSCFLCHVCIKNDTCDGACNPKWRGLQRRPAHE